MAVRTATQLVELCENQLGFTFDLENGVPIYKQRQREVAKIKRKMKENPKLYTLANLELAVEYSWRKRLAIKSPLALFHRVEWALREAAENENPTDAQAAVQQAVNWELTQSDDMAEVWIGRLMRAQGRGALDTYKLWKEAGRGG